MAETADLVVPGLILKYEEEFAAILKERVQELFPKGNSLFTIGSLERIISDLIGFMGGQSRLLKLAQEIPFQETGTPPLKLTSKNYYDRFSAAEEALFNAMTGFYKRLLEHAPVEWTPEADKEYET